MVYITKDGNANVDKPSLKFNGGLTEPVLISFELTNDNVYVALTSDVYGVTVF